MDHPAKRAEGRVEYSNYLGAWHQDRLLWLETLRKTVSFANAGGAVAVAAAWFWMFFVLVPASIVVIAFVIVRARRLAQAGAIS